MTLLDEARAQMRGKGSACTVGAALSQDDGELAEALDAVRAGALQGIALERALAVRGVKLAAQNIRRHARGECQCNVAA